MARVVLITGGNLGDVKSRLRTAQRMINDKVGIVLRCSHRYKSRPWGFKADDEFSNQVLEVDTDLSADEVLDAVQAIERKLGRDREEEARLKAETGAHYSSRMIDIDILFYDDLVLESPRLTIPHPLIEERDFVLAPLCELMKSKKHPVSGKTMEELRAELLSKHESEVIGNE